MFQEGDKLSDEDLYKYLIDIKRPANVLKKLKCIPGKLIFRFCNYVCDQICLEIERCCWNRIYKVRSCWFLFNFP